MRRTLIATLLLALAACAQQASPAPEPSIDWRTEVRGDDLLVRLADRRGYYRVERVSLVAPSGRSYPAFELTREVVREEDRYPYPYGPGVGLGGGFGSGGSSSVGVGVSVPLGGGYGRGGSGAWTEARIPLPQAPQPIGPDWKIVVELSDPAGAARVAELPAPNVRN